MKNNLIHKKILEFDYFKLQAYIIEYRENLSNCNNGELKKAKKNLSILERYRDNKARREKIETLIQMKNRTLDKHIKKGVINENNNYR